MKIILFVVLISTENFEYFVRVLSQISWKFSIKFETCLLLLWNFHLKCGQISIEIEYYSYKKISRPFSIFNNLLSSISQEFLLKNFQMFYAKIKCPKYYFYGFSYVNLLNQFSRIGKSCTNPDTFRSQ